MNSWEEVIKNGGAGCDEISQAVFYLSQEFIVENKEVFLDNFKNISLEAQEKLSEASFEFYKRFISHLLFCEDIETLIKIAVKDGEYFKTEEFFDEVIFLDEHQGDYEFLSPKIINLFTEAQQNKIYNSKDSHDFRLTLLVQANNPLSLTTEEDLVENFSSKEIQDIFKNKPENEFFKKTNPYIYFKTQASLGVFDEESFTKAKPEDLVGFFYSENYDSLDSDKKKKVLIKIYSEDMFSIKGLDYQKKVETITILAKQNLYKIKGTALHVKDQEVFDGKKWKVEEVKDLFKIKDTPKNLTGEYNPFLETFREGSQEYSLDFLIEEEVYSVYKPNKWIKAKARKSGDKFLVSIIKEKRNLEIVEFPDFNVATERPFGFEIEFCSQTPLSDISLALEANLSEEDPIQSKGYSWDVKPDPSLRSSKKNFFSVEIASPKLIGEEGIKELVEKMKTLKEEFSESIWVNKSCGIHIHHDISDLKALDAKKTEIVGQLFKYQDLLFNECQDHRRELSASAPLVLSKGKVKEKDFTSKAQENFTQHKGGFKVFAGHNQSTLEFRMMESSFDIEKIVRWIRLTHLCVESLVLEMKEDYDKQKNMAQKFIAFSAENPSNIEDLVQAQDLLVK